MEIRPWSPSRPAAYDLSKAAGFTLGPLTVDPPMRTVHNARLSEMLEPRVMRVLVALRGEPGRVFSRDDLIELCWDGQIVGDNAINRVISRLRAVLAKLAGETVRLETITKVGFRLIGIASDLPAAPVPFATTAASIAVAVLAFDNLSDDPANGYLADGLAEELIIVLSRLPGLRVPARTSSFAYRGRPTDARTIGRELGVARLIEGSVRVVGMRVRATVQLIDAANGFHLWAGNFNREMTDLFAMQDDIASAVASALETELTGRVPPTRDLEAYQLYMQARSLLDRWNQETVLEGVSLFRQALARDPSFALAATGLTSILVGASVAGLLPLSVRQEALELAEQTARNDPGSTDSQVAIGCLASLRGCWEAADCGFGALTTQSPHEPYGHFAHAHYLLAPCGHLAKAQAAANRAFELAPAVALFSLGRATMARMCNDRQGGMAGLEMAETLGVSPDDPGMRVTRAAISLHVGSWEKAAEHLVMAFPPKWRAVAKEAAEPAARAILGLDDKLTASATLMRLVDTFEAQALQTHSHLVFGALLDWQARLGALDPAFDICSRIVAAWRRTGHLATLNLFSIWTPHMRPFRYDPRFQDFVEQLGMFEYWHRNGPPDGHALRDGKLICL